MANEQSTTSLIQSIPFYDESLLVLIDERTGKEYVLPKPMTELLGLAWSGQLRKMKRNQIFIKGMTSMFIPSAGGEQETVLLERRLVHAWLLSIEVTRLKPALQAKVLKYQDECADVLDAYFSHGSATNPRVHTRGDMLVQMAEAYREQERRIAVLEAQELARTHALIAQQADLIATQQKALEGFLLAERADTKADLALEDARRLTVEEFVVSNGVLRQFPPTQWPRIAKWLTDFCQQWGLHVVKAAVPGKIWNDENTYPLSAFGAWYRQELQRPTQIRLVKDEDPPRL
jgi:hypothetical protein